MERLLHFLKQLHDEAIGFAGTLTFNLADEQHRLMACLFSSEVELAGAYHTLAQDGKWTGTPSILRSMLETFVHLKNISADAAYARFMEAGHRTEWAKLLRSAQEFGNRFLQDVAEIPNLDELRAEHDARLAELDQIQVRKLRIEQEFERAGMSDVYRSVYQYLCSEVHGTVGSLFNRHIVFQNHGPLSLSTEHTTPSVF
jgi:hypothetical protein